MDDGSYETTTAKGFIQLIFAGLSKTIKFLSSVIKNQLKIVE